METEGSEPAVSLFDAVAVGEIVFAIGANHCLRFCPDGKVFVRGELVASNYEVYQAFLEWFRKATFPLQVCPVCGSQVSATDSKDQGVWNGVEWPT